LRYFVAVAEAGGVTAAARDLHVAQSAVSRAVQGVERELGEELFERYGRGLRLTEAGVVFLGEARAVLSRFDAAITSVRDRRGASPHQVRLGAPSDLPPGFLVAWSDALARLAPPVQATFNEMHSSQVAEALVAGRLHAALVRLPFDHPGITCAQVLVEDFGVEFDARSPLAAQERVSLADLDGMTWLSFERSEAPGWYDEVARRLACEVERPLIRSTGSDRQLKLDQLRLGPCYAFAPAWHAQAAERAGCVQRPLAGDPLRRVTALAWAAHQDVYLDGPLSAAIAAARASNPADAASCRHGMGTMPIRFGSLVGVSGRRSPWT